MRLRLVWRSLGILGLGASLATVVVPSGWGIGIEEWLGLLSAAAVTVALLLAYRPQWSALRRFLSPP